MKINKKAMIFGVVGFLTGSIVGCNNLSIKADNGFIGQQIGNIESNTNTSGRIAVYKFTDPYTFRDYIIIESDKGIAMERAD